jgi:hypothetical protein
MPVITLTTDFGTADPFVGLMKGVILTIAPQVTMVDLSHEVSPQDIMAAGLVLEAALDYFPAGTIHIGIVDPGVGGERMPIAVKTEHYLYVGPDNGLFTAVMAADGVDHAVALTNRKYHLDPVSDTFHGRDIFAPAAAHLANGEPLENLGNSIRPHRLQLPEPWQVDDNLELHVLHIDRFGNVVTDLRVERFNEWLNQTPREQVAIEVNDITILGVVNTYSETHSHRPLAYIGSVDRLEIAMRDGHAADELNINKETVIRLARQP